MQHRNGMHACRTLSVYVPEQCTPASPCPVMHWIHGGAWIEGSNGRFDGTRLASKHGIVMVAGNYRLDSLGWLALTELEQEANST